MLYKPKLRNGRLAPLTWPIAIFRFFNPFCWPLDDDVAKYLNIIVRCYFFFFLMVFVQHNDAETRFFIANLDNIDRLLSGVPGYLVHLEMSLRCIHLSLHKQKFKKFLKRFYEDIYIEKTQFPQHYRSIQRNLLPTFTYSATYLITSILFVITPLVNLYNQHRDLLFAMIYPYDIQPLYVYLPTVFASAWFTLTTTATLVGESNVMAKVMMHLHVRYLLLGEDLQRSAEELLQQGDSETISQEFGLRVKQIIQRNMELNKFAAEFQRCFSYRIFIIFSFAAVLLCVLAFKVYTPCDMLYRPRLKNGKFVSLSLPISWYRQLNFICWPLADDASEWCKILNRSYFLLFLVIYVQHNDAQTRYFITNRRELDLMLGVVPAYLVQLEMTLRGVHINLHQQQFKRFLQKFYADIYIERSSNPELYQSIQRKLRPTFAYSSTYIMTLALYVATPAISLYNQRRDFLYDMIYPYDIQPLYVYLPVVILSVWFSCLAVTMLFGEANVIAEVILHLHGQYLMLGEELQRSSKELLQHVDEKRISQKFREKLKNIIQRNVELNEFAQEFQKCFSFRIFIIFSFAAMLLCVLGFKVYTNVSNGVSFAIWMISKIVEILAFGDVGSTLIATSNDVSYMYYNSNWELIISSSSNTQENINLMKLLVIAMETNMKPFTLTGLNFFSVSLAAVLKILNASGSYFACLISIR